MDYNLKTSKNKAVGLFKEISELRGGEILAELGAYLIINQVLFYYLLERKWREEQKRILPEIREIGSLKDLQKN